MNNPNQHIPDNLIERLSTRWNEMTSDALTMDNDWLADPDAEEAAWAIAQLVAWPTRIDEDRTTNDRFLRMSVAALALRQQAALESAEQQIFRLHRCLGFFASVIKSGEPWTATCESEYQAALNKQESLG